MTRASTRPAPPHEAPARNERQRDRAATKVRIPGAVGAVLARDGFGAVGVNAIARQAGVDKVLIYRTFGGVDLRSDAGWMEIKQAIGVLARQAFAPPRHEPLHGRQT